MLGDLGLENSSFFGKATFQLHRHELVDRVLRIRGIDGLLHEVGLTVELKHFFVQKILR
jgi:hypothetical protein